MSAQRPLDCSRLLDLYRLLAVHGLWRDAAMPLASPDPAARTASVTHALRRPRRRPPVPRPARAG